MPTISLLNVQQKDRCKDQPIDWWHANITAASNASMRCALLATAFAGLALSSQVQAASFDCSKAQSFSEKAVCNTPQLSALDDTLGAAYAKAYAASLNKPAIAATRVHEWHWRQSHCRDTTCVENWYTRRIAEVEADYAQSTHRVDSPSSDSCSNSCSDTNLHASSTPNDSSTIDASTDSSVTTADKKTGRPSHKVVSKVSSQTPAKNNPPLPPSAATSSETAAKDTLADNAAAISWSLPAPSASWNDPPLPPMSSHTPMDTRKIRPLDTTASVSSRTIGIFVGF